MVKGSLGAVSPEFKDALDQKRFVRSRYITVPFTRLGNFPKKLDFP